MESRVISILVSAEAARNRDSRATGQGQRRGSGVTGVMLANKLKSG